MPVAASEDQTELRLEPTLERARELAREGNLVPVRARFVDDCETPVSAFLKLRAGEPEGAPCFLLESAEQGQVGRYSFVGLRPRAVLRWSDGVLAEWTGEEAAAGDAYRRSFPCDGWRRRCLPAARRSSSSRSEGSQRSVSCT